MRKFGFTRKEVKDLIISTLALAFIFFYPGYQIITEFNVNMISKFFFYLIIIIFVFIPHEMAHKFLAMKYRCIAQYQMWKTGLKIAMFLAIITNGNFIIAAPGAVMIYTTYYDLWGREKSRIGPKENAYISMAGPLVNLLIAILMLSFFIGKFTLAGLDIGSGIALVCTYLAFFNLLPIPPLDGSKIFAWRIDVWAFLIAIAFVLLQII